MGPSGFSNSFTSGEICEDAWDRTELQPVAKGCQLAQNLVQRIPGPLGKRRGFWLVAPASSQVNAERLIEFIRSPTDALILEFGNLTCTVWQTNGEPFGSPQVTFTTPYTSGQLASLRWKQIGDVIEFRSSLGLAPQSLSRANGGVIGADWTFAAKTYTNGPWLAENADLTSSVTLTNTGGPADLHDTNTTTGAGAIPAGATVAIASTDPIFTSAMIGQQLRIRANGTSVSALSWTPGVNYGVGDFATSVGSMYQCASDVGNGLGSNPPVQTQGNQSDGCNVWTYVHDGAGVIEITGFTDTMHVTGTVQRTVPIKSAVATSYWSFGAYSAVQGWPTAWPELREERLVDGATATNLDFADLTQTAGFSPTTEDFTPGTGLGTIVDTNAIRRRVGIDGAQIMSFTTATYLVALTESSEQLIAGSVLDEPLSPEAITIKQLSNYGSADVRPVQAHKGILWVTQEGQTLRELQIDTQQGASGDDHSVLAQHLAVRGFAQLAWAKYPDNACWIRLADGGFCQFTYHKEQEVKGFTTQQLPNGMTVLDEIVMPGPGNRPTLWVLAQNTVAGVTSTYILMQSQPSDNLFMDGALFYEGAAAGTLAGFPAEYNGQLVDVLCEDTGAWYPQLEVIGGEVTLPDEVTTTQAQAGFIQQVEFISGKLDLRVFLGGLLQRQRMAGCIVDVATAYCTVSGDGVSGESLDARYAADTPGTSPKRFIREFTLETTGDSETGDRDPRVVIKDATPYNFVLYAIKPNRVQLGE